MCDKICESGKNMPKGKHNQIFWVVFEKVASSLDQTNVSF